ncbi:MAG TPA: hypothetical protein VJQ06_02060 [Rhizomicrobium sp.]|nr:hypothetical protein [Rhizomicrobium sp.]
MADMKPATLNLWIRDGLIGGDNDRIAESQGGVTLLAVDTVFAVALASVLRQRGAHPTIACKAANSVAYLKAPLPSSDAKPKSTELGNSSNCVLVTEKGEARFVTMQSALTGAVENLGDAALSVMDAAWVVPYDRIAMKVMQAAWNKRGREKK